MAVILNFIARKKYFIENYNKFNFMQNILYNILLSVTISCNMPYILYRGHILTKNCLAFLCKILGIVSMKSSVFHIGLLRNIIA